MVRKTALITGASSGIGLELATVFAREKNNLVLVARSEKKLKDISKGLAKLYGVKVEVISQDLAKKGAAKSVFDALKKKKINVSYLVNNAGFGSYGAFKDLSLKSENDMVQVNIVALIELTHYFSSMLEKNKGKILNVASVAAFQPIPNMATYAATKSFVLSFSEALNVEFDEVSVSALCPGATKTNFSKTAHMENRVKTFEGSGVMSAQKVAQEGYDGMMKGLDIIVPGSQNKALGVLSKIVPNKFSARIAKSLME